MKNIAFLLFVLVAAVGNGQESKARVQLPYWWTLCLDSDVVVAKGRFDAVSSERPDVRIIADKTLKEVYFEGAEPPASLDKAFYCVRFHPKEILFISRALRVSLGKHLQEAGDKGVATMLPVLRSSDGALELKPNNQNEAVYIFKIQPLILERDLVMRASIPDHQIEKAKKLFEHLASHPDPLENAPSYEK